MSSVFEDLKRQLDALVADQQKKYDEWEAKLAKMSEGERAVLYGKQAGSGIWGATIGGLVDMVKALPGFYVGYLKTLAKVALYPSELVAITAEAIATGSMGPLEAEVDKMVKPFVNGYEEAQKYKSILLVLLSDEQTLHLLHDFAERYYDATHPLELTEMGASAASDIVVTLLLAIFTAGVGAAANVAAKSTRLAKVAQILKRLAKMLKRAGYRQKLPKKHMSGSAVVTNSGGKAKKAVKGGMPEPKSINTKKDQIIGGIENKTENDKILGRKKIPDRADFSNPKDAYGYVRKLEGDVEQIHDSGLNFSSKEVNRMKTEIREWFPIDEYPDMDYSAIDKALDNDVGNAFSKDEIKGVKNYLFDNPKLAPGKNLDPDIENIYFNNAESWIRLANNEGVDADNILVKHEIMETRLKKEFGIEKMGEKLGKSWIEVHEDCHYCTEELFNYAKAIKGE